MRRNSHRKINKVIVFFVFVSGCNLINIYSQNSKIITSGDESPAIVAKEISISYGISYNVVDDIIDIFDSKGYSAEERNRKVNLLIKKYSEQKNEIKTMSDLKSERLGIRNDQEIIDILKWDIFVSTEGKNSPAIYAYGGQVGIWYGMPEKTFIRLYRTLENQSLEQEELEKKIQNESEKYQELVILYNIATEKDNISQEAMNLFDEGKFEEAERILEADLAFRDRWSALKHYQLGLIKEFEFKYIEASESLYKAIVLDDSIYHYQVAYANNLLQLGKHKKAIKHYRNALDLIDYSLDSISIYHYGTALYNLGETYFLSGNLDSAIYFSSISLQVNLNLYGNNSIRVGYNHMNLGKYYSLKDGSFYRADYHYGEALAISRSLSVEDPLYEAYIHENIAVYLVDIGLFNKAIQHYHTSIDIVEDFFKHDNSLSARLYNKIAAAYVQVDELDTALHYCIIAKDLNHRLFGKLHPQIATNNSTLGVINSFMGNYDEGIYYCLEALKIDSIFQKDNHMRLASSYFSLGLAFILKKEYGEAVYYLEESLTHHKQVYKSPNINLVRIYMELGLVYFETGYCEKGLNYMQNSVDILTRLLPPDNPFLNSVRKNHYLMLREFNRRSGNIFLPLVPE